MYKITTKSGKVFTCPKESIKGLAFIQAHDRNELQPIFSGLPSTDEAIAYLTYLGMEVEETDEK